LAELAGQEVVAVRMQAGLPETGLVVSSGCPVFLAVLAKSSAAVPTQAALAAPLSPVALWALSTGREAR
jgi:hypothetical protein